MNAGGPAAETAELEPDGEESLNFKRILPLFVIVLVDLLGLTIIIPLLPLYATSYGADPFLIGLLGATYPIMQFLGAPFLGRLSDRYGRKPVLVVSQIGTFVGFVLLGVAGTLWLLFVARVIDGISGANIATAQAAISDSTTEKTRTQGLGLIGAAFGLGFIIGPIIAFASLALSGNNYSVPAFVAAAFSLLSILLTSFWFKETLPAELRGAQENLPSFWRRMHAAITHPAIGILLLLIFAQQLAFGGFEQILSLFLLNRLGLNAAGSSIVFVFVGVIVVAVQGGLIGRWSRAYGDRRLIYAGLALLAVAFLLMAFTPQQGVPWYDRADLEAELTAQRTEGALVGETPATQSIPVSLPTAADTGWTAFVWILIALVPAAIGGGILHPAINSLITKRVDAREIGGVLGVSAALLSGANALGPVVGGALFDVVGARAPFFAWAVLAIFLLVAALQLVRPGREVKQEPGLARGGAAD